MKLRNKKTGETGELHFIPDKEYHFTVETEDPADMMIFKTLAELNEEWEDYEEPEGCCVTMYGGITRINNDDVPLIPDLKEIGNYFNDKESAYDALDKLKAWKRLKDKGAEFYGWRRNQTGTYELYLRWEDKIPRSYEVKNDLNLLFGGEE